MEAGGKGTCCTPESMEKKLKILAFHGYRQNAEAFLQKTGSFRKMVHKWATFRYIQAPHTVQVVNDTKPIDNVEEDPKSNNNEDQYGWFFNGDDCSFSGLRKGGPSIGFEDSVEYVERVFKEEGPFDGILGFSQGACFAGLLCCLQQRKRTTCKFDFAILVSGFKSESFPHKKLYNELITIPSLHIFGENDAVIPSDMSETLSTVFKWPAIVNHSGGHYLPASAPQKHEYQNFFKLMQSRRDEQLHKRTLPKKIVKHENHGDIENV